MTPAIGPESRFALNRGYRLQWEDAQNANVLLFPEGLIKLNVSAGEILKRCNGKATLAEITTDLEMVFAKNGLSDEVMRFIAMALEQRWLKLMA